MKNLILLTLLISTSFAVSSQQYGWMDLSENIPPIPLSTFTDVYAIGEEVWIADPNSVAPYIIYSSDGGQTFSLQSDILETGVYFCRLICENKSATQKLIIQK